MNFRPVYYIVVGSPSLAKTHEMVDKYIEHGVTAIQLDMPSRNPYGESEYIQGRMKQALSQTDNYQDYIDAILAIRARHPELELHLVCYPDVVESVGIERFIAFCKQAGIYAVLAGSPEMMQRMRENGIYTSTFINYDLNDQAIEHAKSNERQIVFLRNKKDGVTPRPGIESVKDRLAYVRERGVAAPIFAVAGITTKQMLEECKLAGCDGAYLGSSLMKLWDDEQQLWRLLDEFQSVAGE